MSGYFNAPVHDEKCLKCGFLTWEMVDADEVCPYCNKWKKYADEKIKECKRNSN